MSADPTHSHNEPAGASDDSIQKVHAELLHRQAEPKRGYSPMPLFLLGFISSMIFLCAIYFVHNRAGFDAMVYDQRFDPAKAGAQQVAAVDPMVAGKKLYAGTCQACHQENGKGVPGAFPPLAGSEWAMGSEERVIRILLHGLGGPVSVEGVTYNGAMPAFGQGGYNWDDNKIAQVLTYVRQSWGNTAAPVTKEKVAEIRAAESAHVGKPWTAGDLESFK